MRSLELALQGASKVLIAGLIFGAGMPVIYALGMRMLTLGATPDATGVARPSTLGKTLAAVFLIVVVGVVALGITIIAATGFGKTVSFDNLIPTIVDK